MKSLKLYFSLLLSTVTLAVAQPAMAQDVEAVVDNAVAELAEAAQVAEATEAAEVAPVAAPAAGSQGRDNSAIDDSFSVGKALEDFVNQSGFKGFAKDWRFAVMILIAFVLLYLAIVKKFEPLLLLPIAIGMMLTNLPGGGLFHLDFFIQEHIDFGQVLHDGGLLDLLYLAVLSENERDELYPKIARGFAAEFLSHLNYDEKQKDYVETQKLDAVIREYYDKYLKIYLENHSGLKYSKLSFVQKELDFIVRHEVIIRGLWEKSTLLSNYPILFEYAKMAETNYERYLSYRKNEMLQQSHF